MTITVEMAMQPIGTAYQGYAAMPALDMAARLGLSVLCGLALGLDREWRGIAAGLRTHAMISLSSAVITLSSFMIYDALRTAGEGAPDPLRVIQGLAQAIGFIGAGAIFVARNHVRNLTTAVNMWLASAVGIAAGAGQTTLALVSTGLGLFVLVLLGFAEGFMPRRGRRPGHPDAQHQQSDD